MTVLHEGARPAEFLMSEARGQRSRENVTVAAGSGVIAPGAVLGVYTAGASEGYYSLAPAEAADPDVGNQVAVAVALYGADATTDEQTISVIHRDAEVNRHSLVFASSVDDEPKREAKIAQLRAAGIIAR